MTGDAVEVHRIAATGFENNATEYELARPSYPPEAVAFLIDRLELGPGRTVADVGAGTGKLTRLLVPSGAAVVAVEPLAAMRAELLRALPAAEVHDGVAEHLPFANSSVDAIVCAQAFHWFATTEVLDEFARVLRPGRRLGLIWNLRDESLEWVRAFTELLEPYEGGRPSHSRGLWREVFERDGPFGPLETTSFSHSQKMTPELLVSRAASMSFIGAIKEPMRGEVLKRVRALGERQGEKFVLPYRTDVHVAVRR